MRITIPILEKEVNGRKLINPHFGKSNLFAIFDTETGNLEILENPTLELQRGRGNYIAKLFSEKGIEAVLVKDIGSGALSKLENFEIKVYLLSQSIKFLDEALELFKEGKFSKGNDDF
ncbi:Predicted Fe-Mo cluster-binding protein, NifX family [Balnearium lithotrophicum]|uniref:Predicted Fe-Mo cluster-binding protein, NifX family n=1 Tax=Balnearium lithotrophicum TaxID=223788 RepID=A0A521DDM3_9BACT|nr:NifB/NifX family molybdenum-iron cluster-binding protein [Balnearium lithotrophicum]SMO69695.1 Predicted Fe-Mo cluster-binding protein, NifX family [Balnearium lithotrophicum]